MRQHLVMVVIAVAVIASACSDDSGDDSTVAPTEAPSDAPETEAAPSGEAAITIEAFMFGDPISVSAGTTVTVTNADGVAHTWTADEGAFDSGSLEPGDTFSFAFAEPGDFPFHCSIHSSMTGSVTVDA